MRWFLYDLVAFYCFAFTFLLMLRCLILFVVGLGLPFFAWVLVAYIGVLIHNYGILWVCLMVC